VIIDCHGHVSAPAQLWAYKAGLLAARGAHGRGGVKVTDEEIRTADFDWLSQADRDKIFAGNARKVFNLKI